MFVRINGVPLYFFLYVSNIYRIVLAKENLIEWRINTIVQTIGYSETTLPVLARL